MITSDNFKQVLEKLAFSHQGDVYTYYYAQHNCSINVDFAQKQIIYPTDKGLVVNQQQTTNFAQAENFVVLECVHQLLLKGYRPEHLVLEPTWQVGHGASGGRADILVKNQAGQPYLIIECKTAGTEFDNAWKAMQTKPTQLFSYVEQEKATQFICLYASDFDEKNDTLSREQYIILVKDDDKILANNKKLPSFKNANNVKERFEVWKKTYAAHAHTQGIIEEDIVPYQIGKKKYRIEDLIKIEREEQIQKKYHEFAKILRKYNVSGKENAFDKLVNLFLAKIVDEDQNKEDLQLRWFGITADNYFDFIDRLEELYAEGMKKFLKEEVTVVNQEKVLDAFKYFKNDPNATRETVLNHFRQQKYFTNNDFSFIDVHNEKLFYQNVVILQKIVQMIENIQLNGDQQTQFLGDLFEGFLDRGMKQSEGQFFTPMPIVKFIIMSLPLQDLIKNHLKIPKAIDYACGAGHFLTELAAQLKETLLKNNPKAKYQDYYAQLYGIEKEYRLSKVAKVSASMYGQNEINVFYADALAPHEQIKNESFSLIVANPPFAVTGFLETLTEEERLTYELMNQVSDLSKNRQIQCFFLERAEQLLEVGGLTGIIIPNSILSTDNEIETATREMLIKSFDFVALVELGSRTFGATGTQTVILFLRKKSNNPPAHQHYKERVDKWFSSTPQYQNVFADQHLLTRYCQHINVEWPHYQSFLQAADDVKALEPVMHYEIFEKYKKLFYKQAEKILDTQRKETARKQKQWANAFEKQDLKATDAVINALVEAETQKLQAEQQRNFDRTFINFLKDIEKDKVYFFVMTSANPQKVLIVKSPQANTEQQKFLGYTWSTAKGKEGIKYSATAAPVDEVEDDEDKRVLQNLNAKRHINTPLFDANNPLNDQKINYYIQQNFLGHPLSIPEHLQPFLSQANLVDMLDFSEKTFDKKISLAKKKKTEIESQYPLIRLGDETKVITKGTTPTTIGFGFTDEGINFIKIESILSNGFIAKDKLAFISKECDKKLSRSRLSKNDILFSIAGALGRCTIINEDILPANTNQALAIIRLKDDSMFLMKYVYLFLNSNFIQNQIESLKIGIAQPNLSLAQISDFKIPLPPPSIQAQIVADCEKLEKNKNQYLIEGLSLKDFEKLIKEKKNEIIKKHL